MTYESVKEYALVLENKFQLKRLQDIAHKWYFISKLIVIDVTREIGLWMHFTYGFILFVYVKLIGQRIVLQLFRHIQLQGDNYFL